MRTLIDALPDIVFTKDMWGDSYCAMPLPSRHLGFSREEELHGKTVFDLLPEESRRSTTPTTCARWREMRF